MKQAQRLVVMLAVATLSADARGDAPIPARERDVLSLGATLGDARLELLTWPKSAEAKRLRVLGSNDQRPAKGAIGGYEVLEEQALTPAQLNEFGAVLLDPGTYLSRGIREPTPPSPIRQGSGRLCGGFRPVLALRLRDVEDRIEDVFLCFGCDEVELSPVFKAPDEHTPAPPRRPLEPAPKDAVRRYLSPTGARRLLDLSLALYPQDEALSWQKQRRQRATTDDRRPTER